MDTIGGLIGTPRRIRRGLVTPACVGGLLMIGGCDATTATHPAQDAATVAPNPTTVNNLLAAITSAGLAAPNPRDVTSRDCPQLGCRRRVETDTISIVKFPKSRTAKLYASWTNDRFQIIDVVVSFPPGMPTAKRTAYENAIKGAITWGRLVLKPSENVGPATS